MGLLSNMISKAENSLFLGDVIEDFGVIDERKEKGTTFTLSVMWCERNGEKRLVFKESTRALFGVSVNYHYVSAENLSRLKQVIDAAIDSR